MKTYNGIHFNKICRILTEASQGVASVCGYDYVVSDMIHSLSDLHDKMFNDMKEPYYIAIREQGTESGFKEHCIDRCNGLGYPLVIAKIEQNNVCDWDMTIMFTHNWMNGDTNYMKEEFDSL